MVIKSIVGNLRLSLPCLINFPTTVDSSDLKVAGFLMRTLRGHKRNHTAMTGLGYKKNSDQEVF